MFLNVATERATGQTRALGRRSQQAGGQLEAAARGRNRIGNKQNMSSPSPVTDGKHVWVMTGTGILKAFDFAGKELWTRDIQKDYGKFGIQFGYASSPLLHGDALYLQVLHGMNTDDPSYVLEDRHDDGEDRVARRAADQRAARVAGLLHDAGAAAARRQDRDRHHRRRPRHRPRSGDGQGALARRRAQPAEIAQLPDHLVADRRRRADHRAEAGQPARGARRAARATSRRPTSPGRSIAAPTCRHRSATASTCIS